MQPLISVIVPVYNVEKYLSKCLDCIIGQTYKNLEIICINDGSKDTSLQILERYANSDSRIKIVNKNNGGLSSARNAGLKIAHGEYISFIDSDDFPELFMYERAMACFDDDIDVVVFEYNEQYEDGKTKKYHLNYSGKYWINDDILKNSDHTTWNKIYKASCIKKNNVSFPEGYLYEDIVFFWNLFLSSVKCVYFLQESLHNYRINNASIMGNTLRKKENYSIYHIFIMDKIYDFWSSNKVMAGREHVFIHLCNKFFPLSVAYAPKWEIARCYWEMTSRLRKWNLPLEEGSYLKLVHDGEYSVIINYSDDKYINNKSNAPQNTRLKGFEKIFCIRNEGNHKVARIFTMKIASKRRNKK